jgi:hypothetical protein
MVVYATIFVEIREQLLRNVGHHRNVGYLLYPTTEHIHLSRPIGLCPQGDRVFTSASSWNWDDWNNVSSLGMADVRCLLDITICFQIKQAINFDRSTNIYPFSSLFIIEKKPESTCMFQEINNGGIFIFSQFLLQD